MTVLHETSTFNVVATLNQWVIDELAAITLPAWLADFDVVIGMPEASLPTPCLSLHHLPVSQTAGWESRAPSSLAVALLEINAWVSRSSISWLAQLDTLQSMIGQIVAKTNTLAIQDYLSVPGTPVLTPYKIEIDTLEVRDTAPDPNPDIARRRMTIRYQWHVRSE